MEYVYAALLLHKVGKAVNEQNVTKLVTAAGIKADSSRVKALIASLEDVDIDEAVKAGPVAMVTAPTAAASPAPEKKDEAKKKEKPEEDKDKEEAALEGLGALFG